MTDPLKNAAVAPARAGIDLVLHAMRIAERAHRGQKRKAPAGQDQPDYFLHLAEVAWRLSDAGLPGEVVAAGFLHDTIEDCGFTEETLAEAIGNPAVANLVQWVSEPEKAHNGWHDRNTAYRARIRQAPREALALSIADKTANMRDMLELVDKGYGLSDFLSVGATDQIRKFEALRDLFVDRVPATLLTSFDEALADLAAKTEGERNEGEPTN